MRKIKVILSLWMILCIMACQDSGLDAKSVRDLLSGNTVRGRTEKGDLYHVFIAPSGTGFMQVENNFSDIGQWHIDKEGRFCTKWLNVRQGIESCFTVTLERNIIFFTSSQMTLELVLLNGNPMALPKPDSLIME